MSIKIQNVSMQFKNNLALDEVNLEIGEGIFGLLGQNGAGKTTLMRILATLLTQTKGLIDIYGKKVQKENYEEIKKIIGYLPQELGLYPNLTVSESLDYMGGLCGMSKKARVARIDSLLELTNLTEHQKKKNRQLSGGMKRRVGLVQAMLHSPKLLIVDEPTSGLDPEERIRIRGMLADFAQGRTIIYSTHVVEDLASTCNNLCVLNKGKIKYDGTVENMLKKAQGHIYQCELKNEKELSNIQDEYFVIGKVYKDGQINVKFTSNEQPKIQCSKVDVNLEDAYVYINNLK